MCPVSLPPWAASQTPVRQARDGVHVDPGDSHAHLPDVRTCPQLALRLITSHLPTWGNLAAVKGAHQRFFARTDFNASA